MIKLYETLNCLDFFAICNIQVQITLYLHCAVEQNNVRSIRNSNFNKNI